jgi:hypothetical protein
MKKASRGTPSCKRVVLPGPFSQNSQLATERVCLSAASVAMSPFSSSLVPGDLTKHGSCLANESSLHGIIEQGFNCSSRCRASAVSSSSSALM